MADMSNHSFDLPHPANRDLFFTDQVEQKTISDLTRNILHINKSDALLVRLYAVYGITYTPAPINIYIDSYGGHVYQCFGLLSVMERSLTPIHTIITGTAMSCGYLIALCGHRRFCHKMSTLMYHQVSGGVVGKARDMEEDLEEVKRLQALIEKVTIEKTDISIERIKEVYLTKKDWYMDAEESLRLNCVDEILE